MYMHVFFVPLFPSTEEQVYPITSGNQLQECCPLACLPRATAALGLTSRAGPVLSFLKAQEKKRARMSEVKVE